MYDTLVLSGGGVNGILELGALQYCNDKNLLSSIKTYVGTSIGSIICYLLIIGYTPVEIIVYLCTHNKLLEEEVSYFRIQTEVTVHLHNRDIIVVVASPNMQYSNNS